MPTRRLATSPRTADPGRAPHDDYTPPTPVVKVSPKCPSCGRESVIVFQIPSLPGGQPLPEPRLVCLACCPKAPNAA